MQDDEFISIQEFMNTRESLRTTFKDPTSSMITTLRTSTQLLINDHYINFDLLCKHYSSTIFEWIGKKGELERKLANSA